MVTYTNKSKSVVSQRSNSFPIIGLGLNDDRCEKNDCQEESSCLDVNFDPTIKHDSSSGAKDLIYTEPKVCETNYIQRPSLKYVENRGADTSDIASTSVSFGPLAIIRKAFHVNEAERKYINHQMLEKSKLERDIQRLKLQINSLRNDVSELNKGLLNQAKRIAQEVDRAEFIKQDIEKLRDDITHLVNEMEPEPDKLSAPSDHIESIGLSVNCDIFNVVQERSSSSSCDYDDVQWKCGACTFLNHNALAYCELCHFPRSKTKKTFAMDPLLNALLEMGFPKEKAEKALKATDGAGISQAMDWLITHEDALENDVDPLVCPGTTTSIASKQETKDEVESAPMPIASSYKCDDCGRMLKNEQEIEFHAAKTNHANFSESTDTIKAMTPEEKREQMKKLQERLRLRREQKDMEEKQKAIEMEKNRRKMGQEMLAARERIQEEEMKKAAEERKRQKIEDDLAKKRILEEIKRDKEARKMENQSVKEFPKQVIAKVAEPVISPVNCEDCKIHIRQLNGQNLTHTFGAREQLSAVRLYVELYRTDSTNEPFTFMTTFPKKVFSDEDMNATLESLGLTPSCVLIMMRK
uniref:UBX domain-containing protein 1 n=1 Tax=Romanomermis culicivorax TaxID=13658 RepID=A0A915J228_ROMCU